MIMVSMINNDNEGNIKDKTWIILIITKTIIIATNNLVSEEKLNNDGYDTFQMKKITHEP